MNTEDMMGEFHGDGWKSAGVRLTRLSDERLPTDSAASYRALIRDWATTYLVAPHPELGREGPVCPFTAGSINKEMFWVGSVERADLTVGDIEKITAGAIADFRRLAPTGGPDALLKTILILFPAVTDYSLIDEAQQRLKQESVAIGLMVGQFYPGCEEPGVRNPEFRPLQSPVPLLAIRNMVSSDFPFLAAKAGWIDEYLKRFAPAIPSSVRGLISARFDTQDAEAR